MYDFKENRWCDSLQKRLEDFILDIAISTSVILVPRKDARKRKLTKKKFKTLYRDYKPLNGSFSTISFAGAATIIRRKRFSFSRGTPKRVGKLDTGTVD